MQPQYIRLLQSPRTSTPDEAVSTLALRTAQILAEGVAEWWLWRGRRVRLADGATVTLADTEENQREYHQPASQLEGLGFPMMRMVALMCLASGALLDAAIGPCEGKGNDEQTLLRSLLDQLAHGDIRKGSINLNSAVRTAKTQRTPRKTPKPTVWFWNGGDADLRLMGRLLELSGTSR